MKIRFLFIVLFVTFYLSGCKSGQNTKTEPTVEVEGISADNKLNTYTAHYTDAEYKYGKEIYGQSVRIDIKKEDFANIPNSDFVEFVRINSKMNDNIVIAFDDKTAIIFTNTYESGKYGNLDLDLGISKVIGKYSLDHNNNYVYNEVSKQNSGS